MVWPPLRSGRQRRRRSRPLVKQLGAHLSRETINYELSNCALSDCASEPAALRARCHLASLERSELRAASCEPKQSGAAPKAQLAGRPAHKEPPCEPLQLVIINWRPRRRRRLEEAKLVAWLREQSPKRFWCFNAVQQYRTFVWLCLLLQLAQAGQQQQQHELARPRNVALPSRRPKHDRHLALKLFGRRRRQKRRWSSIGKRPTGVVVVVVAGSDGTAKRKGELEPPSSLSCFAGCGLLLTGACRWPAVWPPGRQPGRPSR